MIKWEFRALSLFGVRREAAERRAGGINRSGPPTPAGALYGGARAHDITFRTLRLTLWRSSLSDSRSSWRRRILSWKIQHTVWRSPWGRHYITGHCTVWRVRYLQPGESTQVGAVLDVDGVGGPAAAAAVRVLGSLCHGGRHGRCSSLGRQSALRYRSGTARLVRAGASGARARPPPPPPALPAAPGRPAGWSSRIVLPPPRTPPLSAFYRHARPRRRRDSLLFVLPKILANPFSPGRVSGVAARAPRRKRSPRLLPGRFLPVPGSGAAPHARTYPPLFAWT